MEALKHILNNIASFSPQNTSSLVWVSVGVIWLVIYSILIHDVFTSAKSGLIKKCSWLILFTALPIVGGLFYSINELVFADWSSSLGGLIRPKAAKNKMESKKNKTSPLPGR